MPNLTDPFGRPYSGVAPHVVPALVVDNKDPDKLGRIKVKFPTLPGGEEGGAVESFWLRQATPNGGQERGLYALPEIEDEVLVAFLFGSQDLGVIIGQFWNGKDKPVPEGDAGSPTEGHGVGWSDATHTGGSTNYDKNDRRIWRSRSGHIFIFDDSDGKETVHLWDKSRKLGLVLDSKEGNVFLVNGTNDLHIRTSNDLYLCAGNDIKMQAGNNIEVESGADTNWNAKSNWSLEAGSELSQKSGTSSKYESGTDFTAKAGTSMKVEGGTTCDVKAGAAGSFKAGPSLTLSAGSVSIN